MIINKSIKNNKSALLAYFRNRSKEFLSEVNKEYGNTEYKKKAKKLNTLIQKAKETLINNLKQKSQKEKWSNKNVLESVLMINYCNYVVMLEVRHSVWSYEYMTFSRRIGELWEPFCKLCFEYPINDLELFIPPLFADVKKMLTTEIEEYIDKLKITVYRKKQLKKYYNKVWSLVTSGEIQLELDLHFIFDGQKYVVDFKSGFGSNEKGNTNRLLLVASIYHNLEENYQPLLFVRSDENNHYFDTLKKSKIWNAFSGKKTYKEIYKYSGYDIQKWIKNNIDWKNDLDKFFIKYLKTNELTKYLSW